MILRPYQQELHDAVIDWCRKYVEPCLVEAATGAGKSICIAAVAKTLHSISGGKHILCLQPNADLVKQNLEKYAATGNPASIYSASAGQKSLRHPVVFATPLTVKNSLRKFREQFCAVIIDEAHAMKKSVLHIVDRMREHNKNLRVIGMTATPYRLGDGYIYMQDENGKPTEACKNPYFVRKVYSVNAQYLIEQGFLTKPMVGQINAQQYDTSHLTGNSFKSSDIERAYHGHGRKTAGIVADVVAQSQGRRGVMLFAATVQHAKEVLDSLPPGMSRMIGGDVNMDKGRRSRLVKDFKEQKFKYLVSVGTMTTGVDFTHVDVIALLRKTESAGLLQQMIGRGLRLHEGKDDVLVLDYAGNIDYHCPDGDLFNPRMTLYGEKVSDTRIPAICKSCGTENQFTARPNPEEWSINKHGNFVDLNGKELNPPVPAHFGRRCQGMIEIGGGKLEQCAQYWAHKECDQCGTDNDIAAKYCRQCRHELVDPNEKLIANFKQYKKNPHEIQCDKIIEYEYHITMTQSGKEAVRADFVTEYRRFSVWLMLEGYYAEKGKQFLSIAQEHELKTVRYRKNKETGFYELMGFNAPADTEPEKVVDERIKAA